MAAMAHSKRTFEVGLNIHLLSFTIARDLIKDNENVRVSITTFPEGVKQHFRMHAKNMGHTNHVFTLNITNQTKMILIVFRKKSFMFNDPIIACTTIHSNQLIKIPQNFDTSAETICSDVKILNIYEPILRQNAEGTNNNIKQRDRKVNGQIQVQFSITAPYIESSLKKNKKSKSSNGKVETKLMRSNECESSIPKHYKGKCNNDYILI